MLRSVQSGRFVVALVVAFLLGTIALGIVAFSLRGAAHDVDARRGDSVVGMERLAAATSPSPAS